MRAVVKHVNPVPPRRPDVASATNPTVSARPGTTTDAGNLVLGRGRSGVVYRDHDAAGRQIARKVFDAHGLTKLVQWLFLGAPNPYLWSEDAVQCAGLRRRILVELVPLWTQGRLGVAACRDVSWNEAHRAFELSADLVEGRPPRLHHPRRMEVGGELAELRRDVMRPLQAKLRESGFDGLVWQAGLGNPVALNNFLRCSGTGRAEPWAWIDLESGVPAFFPLDPRAFFRFYLPRAFRWRRVMFDEVDVVRLRDHLASEEVRGALPEQTRSPLNELAERLATHQNRWKSLPRHERSIGYRLARGEIDADEADWYGTRAARWYAREGARGLRKLPRKLGELGARVLTRLAAVPLGRILAGAGRFLISQRFRYAIARRHVSGRIHVWEQRGQLEREDADFLRAHLTSEESSAYLTDFGVHLAIKPFVKAIEYWLVPTLFAVGLVGEGFLAFALLTFGALARTLYTSGRLVQSALHGREKPWIALVVGILPVVGNFAYPLQLIWSSTSPRDDLARFILYDGFARIGEHLPIWGGRDTLTEHWLNRLPEHFMRLRPGGCEAGRDAGT